MNMTQATPTAPLRNEGGCFAGEPQMEKSLSTMARLGIRQAIGANAGIFLPLILGASYDILNKNG